MKYSFLNYLIERLRSSLSVLEFFMIMSHEFSIFLFSIFPDKKYYAPAKITDLTVSAASYDDYSVTLKWTATGSELNHGTGRSLFTQYTVQTYNSCTSRPDVCQCLVVQTPMDKTSPMDNTHG